MKQPGYRHELKYYINQGNYTLLSNRLRLTMELDKYCRKNGEYFIRSLYFDDWDNNAFRTKLEGVDDRDKYRIRIYNFTDSAIKLECKHKENSYILKNSLMITREEAESLIAGDFDFLLQRPEPFAKIMYFNFRTKLLKPRVIVDYSREAYVFPLEDIRVTFDKNVRTAFRTTDLFERAIPTYPVVQDYDMIMEVKFNRYLSTYIRDLIQISSAQHSAISKYCLCRKFEL
ncbi:MAG: VTC domain protein [Firmicutes bacterium ADurb.Bin182]|nr:MAG: VTC domain protein [Firmicutes bacterium ADurb.Bin182]